MHNDCEMTEQDVIATIIVVTRIWPTTDASLHKNHNRSTQLRSDRCFRFHVTTVSDDIAEHRQSLISTAFAGQLSAQFRNRIGAILRKALRRNITHTAFDMEEIKSSTVSIANFLPVLPNPVTVCHLLPPKTSAYCPYSLQKRQHSYQCPHVKFSQYKNSYISWCLFRFRWLDVVFRVSECMFSF